MQDATHFRRARDPETGKEVLEPCSPGEQGAFEATLQVGGREAGAAAAAVAAGAACKKLLLRVCNSWGGRVASLAQVITAADCPPLPARNPCPRPFPPLPPPLQTLADKGLAELVHPPKITFRDFEKVLLRARPTVSTDDLQVFTKYTAEFGEEGS